MIDGRRGEPTVAHGDWRASHVPRISPVIGPPFVADAGVESVRLAPSIAVLPQTLSGVYIDW